MSTDTAVPPVRQPAPIRTRTAAVIAVLLAVAVAVYGAFGDPNPSTSQEHGVPFVAGADIVLAGLLFGLLVPWAAKRTGRAAGWGLALGVVALLAVPMAFWSGATVILAGAGVLLGTRARPGRLGGAAVIVGTIAAVGSLLLVILGNTVLA